MTSVERFGSSRAIDLLNSLKEQRPVLLVGSAVSRWAPTCFLTGQEFTRATCSLLFKDLRLKESEAAALERIFFGMPFEHLMELCPAATAIEQLLRHLYGVVRPNALHVAIAKALQSGKISGVITTNYDCNIESCFDLNSAPTPRTVSSEERFAHWRGEPLLFKIHGSLDHEAQAPPVFRLSQEHLLPTWKRNALHTLCASKPLIIIGYSGLDFELCPELRRCRYSSLIWNSFDATPPSPNASEMLARSGGVLLCGDMREILHYWLDADRVQAGDGRTPNGLVSDVFAANDIAEWRLSVLNSLGLPKLAIRAAREVSPGLSRLAIRAHVARAQFNAGKYLSAGLALSSLSARVLLMGDKTGATAYGLQACDSYRSAGAHVRAYAILKYAQLIDRESNHALLKRCLLRASAAEVLDYFRLPRVGEVLRRPLTNMLHRCAQCAVGDGAWLDFQQTGLLASRLGIALDVVDDGEYYPPPEPRVGYQHLGYYVAQVMCLLDECREHLRQTVSGSEPDDSLIDRIDREIDTCRTIGLHSGVWKLALARRSLLGVAVRFREETFEGCQYRPLMKRIQWRRYTRLGGYDQSTSKL